MPRTSFLALSFALVAAVGAPLGAQKPITQGDFESYRLTMANVERVVTVARNMKALEGDPEIKRWAAEQRARAAREDGSTGGKSEAEAANKMVAFLSAQPKLRAAVEGAGLTVRDYALTSMALITGGLIVGMEKQYGTKVDGRELTKHLKGAQLDNVKLLRANWARVSALSEELKKYELKQREDSSEGGDDPGGDADSELPTR